MRLRLNTTLRAALIAAISTFAMATTAFADVTTGTQTFGAGSDPVLTRGDTVFGQEWYVTKNMTAGIATSSSLTLDNAVNIWGGNLWAGSYTVSIWVTKASLDSNCLLFAYSGNSPTNTQGANGIYWNATDKTITIGQGGVTNNYAGFAFHSGNTTVSNTITSLGDEDMVNFTFAVERTNVSETNGQMVPTIWVNGTNVQSLSGYGGNMNGSQNPISLYVGTTATYGNVTVTNEQLTSQDAILTLMGLSKTPPPPSIDFIWKGNVSAVWDAETENWTANGSPAKYVASEDNTVTFDSNGILKEVSLAANTTIGTVTVADEYTLNLGGHTLTTDTLAVAGVGASLALTGEGTVAAGSIAAADKTINIDEKVVLTGEGSGTLAGKGTYALASGSISKGSIVLGGDWTGVVRISQLTAETGNLQTVFANLSNNGKGSVEVNNVKGWLGGGVSTNLILTGTNEGGTGTALLISNGSSDAEYTFSGKVSGAGDFVYEPGKPDRITFTFTGDVKGWTGSYIANKANKTSTLKFSGNATAVNAEIAKNGGTLNVVVGDGTNNFSTTFSKAITANTLTVKDKATATISGDLTANTITVNAGGAMNMGSGTLSTAITNSGSVVLTDTVLDSNGFSEVVGGTAYYALDGTKVEETANHYTGSAESYVQVVNNAEGATSTGTAVWNEQTINLKSNGRIVTGQGGVDYTTFYVTTGETLSNITGSTHGKDLAAINVTGGELVVNESASGIAITVSDDASISGSNLDLTEVGIAAGKTASVEQPLAVSGVKFTAAEGEAVSVQNYGNQTAQYSLTDKNMWVTAGKLEMTDTENNVTVSNTVWMWDGDLVNTTGKTLTLDNMDALMLQNMNITGSTVELTYVDGKEQVVEGTVNIGGILEAGNATLKADLTLLGGSTLNVAGGGDNALTLGSILTIDYASNLINLDKDTIAALSDMNVGDRLDLIVATDETTLDYGGSYNGLWYNEMFASAQGLTGDYKVYAENGAFGVTKTSNVPEPTTGTLSLLALAALAARRRRK